MHGFRDVLGFAEGEAYCCLSSGWQGGEGCTGKPVDGYRRIGVVISRCDGWLLGNGQTTVQPRGQETDRYSCASSCTSVRKGNN